MRLVLGLLCLYLSASPASLQLADSACENLYDHARRGDWKAAENDLQVLQSALPEALKKRLKEELATAASLVALRHGLDARDIANRISAEVLRHYDDSGASLILNECRGVPGHGFPVMGHQNASGLSRDPKYIRIGQSASHRRSLG